MLRARIRETLCLSALVGPILCCIFPPAIADDCDGILEGGTTNQYQLLRMSDFRTNFQHEYCGSYGDSTSSSAGGSLGGMWDGIGVKGGSSESDSSSVKSEVCGKTGSAMSGATYVLAPETVADPRIVGAWKACKIKLVGVIIEPDVHDENITLKYVCKPPEPITQRRIGGDPVITRAPCNRVVADGPLINTGGLVQVCKREGNRPVNVAVNTDFAPAIAYIPPVVHVAAVATTPRERTPDVSIMGNHCIEVRYTYSDALIRGEPSPAGAPIECFGQPGSGPLPAIQPDGA